MSRLYSYVVMLQILRMYFLQVQPYRALGHFTTLKNAFVLSIQYYRFFSLPKVLISKFPHITIFKKSR